MPTTRDASGPEITPKTTSPAVAADLAPALAGGAFEAQPFPAVTWQSAERRPLQRRALGPASASASLPPPGSGAPLPESLQGKMEASFGADFSDVRVHQDGSAEQLGALAYTRGSDLHFQRGRFDPGSEKGQELIGHELTHVVQQREGRVSVPQGKGLPINDDDGLEAEADRHGALAAKGQPVPGAAVDWGSVLNGSGALTEAPAQPLAAAPVQRKADGPIQLETETEKARGQHLEELALNAGGLAAKLKEAGFGGVKFKATADNFELLADALTGQGAGGVAAIAAQVYTGAAHPAPGDSLKADVNKFNNGTDKGKARERYLLHLCTTGQPDNLDRLALSLALTSHSAASTWVPGKPGDGVEVARMFEGDNVAWSPGELAEIRDASKPYKRAIESLGTGKDRVLTALARQGAVKELETAKEAKDRIDAQPGATDQAKAAAQTTVDTKTLALMTAADKHLAAIIRGYENVTTKLGEVKRKKAFDEINAWAAGATNEERIYVVRPGSDFRKATASAMKAYDDELAQHMVRGFLPAAFIDQMIGRDATLDSDTRLSKASGELKLVEKAGGGPAADNDQQGTIASAYGLIKALDRETGKSKGKTLDKNTLAYTRRWFVDSVEAMSDSEREVFIKVYAGRKGIATDDPVAWEATKRAEAVVYIHTTVLQEECGFGRVVAAKVERRLRLKGAQGDTFKILREYPTSGSSEAARLEWLCGKLSLTRVDDVAQIRADKPLFDQMVVEIKAVAGASKGKEWAVRAAELLGLAFPNAAGQIDPAKVDASAAQSAQEGAAEGALQPGFWAQRLRYELDRWFGGKDWGDIAALIHRTRMAADQHAADKGKANAALIDPARKRFMNDVLKELGDLKGKLEGETTGMAPGRNWGEFFQGAYLEPDAAWRVAVSTRGIKDHSSEIATVLEDLSGAALLHQMSNFPEYRTKWDAFEKEVAGGGQGAGKALEINQFVLDVNPTILATIEKEHNSFFGSRGTKSVSLIGSIRKKLVGALETDADAQATFLRVGARFSDLDGMKARMKVVYAMDEESLAKKGVQWDAIDVKGLERREAMWQLKGAHRELSALQQQDGGTTTTEGNLKDAGGQALGDQARTVALDDRAKGLEQATKNVDTKAEDYERRRQSFEEMRATYNGRVMMVVNVLLAAALTAAVSFATAGVASPFVAALIAWGLGLAKSAVATGMETMLSGQLDVSTDALYRLAIQKCIELGTAMATTAVGEAVKGAWENVAGTDWAGKIDGAGKDGSGTDSLLLEKTVGPSSAYNENTKIWLEASKEAGVGFVNKVITKSGEALTTVMTEEDPLTKLGDGARLKSVALGILQNVTTTFAVSVGKQGVEMLIAGDQQRAADEAQEKRDKALDGEEKNGQIVGGVRGADQDKVGTATQEMNTAKTEWTTKDGNFTAAQTSYADTTLKVNDKGAEITTTRGELTQLDTTWNSKDHGGLTQEQYTSQRGTLDDQLKGLEKERTALVTQQTTQHTAMDAAKRDLDAAKNTYDKAKDLSGRVDTLKSAHTDLGKKVEALNERKTYAVGIPNTVLEEGMNLGSDQLFGLLETEHAEESERREDRDPGAPVNQVLGSQKRKDAYALADNIKALAAAATAMSAALQAGPQPVGAAVIAAKAEEAQQRFQRLKRRGDEVELAYQAFQRDTSPTNQGRFALAVRLLDEEVLPGQALFTDLSGKVAAAVDTKAGAAAGGETLPYRRLNTALLRLTNASNLNDGLRQRILAVRAPVDLVIANGEALRRVEEQIAGTAAVLIPASSADPALAARIGTLKAQVDQRADLIVQRLNIPLADARQKLSDLTSYATSDDKVFSMRLVHTAKRRVPCLAHLLAARQAIQALTVDMGDAGVARLDAALKDLRATEVLLGL